MYIIKTINEKYVQSSYTDVSDIKEAKVFDTLTKARNYVSNNGIILNKYIMIDSDFNTIEEIER